MAARDAPSTLELARQSGIPESTLRARLARNGGDVAQALAEPRRSHREAGKLGARRSPWRHPGNPRD
jgi:hypothetical protein